MARCLDIRRERASASDRFLLDTNVELDVGSPLGPASLQRRTDYSVFIARAVSAGARLYVSILSLCEMAHVLEREAYRARHGRPPAGQDELKRFRRDSGVREAVTARLSNAWQQLTSFAEVLEAFVRPDDDAEIIALLRETHLDGYDPLLVLAARRAGIASIVTHDSDFASVRGLIVLTANPRML